MYVAVEDLLWTDMLLINNLRSYKTASLSHSSVGNGLLAISAQANPNNKTLSTSNTNTTSLLLSPNNNIAGGIVCSVKSPTTLLEVVASRSPRSPRPCVVAEQQQRQKPEAVPTTLQANTTDILSRFERGRALRKSAAIEDEDQPVFNEGSSYGLTNPDGIPTTQQQQAAALAAAAANLRATLASSIAATSVAAGTSLGPPAGGLPNLQQALSPEAAAVAAAALASMQQGGFKQEPLSKEELLSLVSNNAPDLLTANPWMNLGTPVNALASLSALIQNTEAGTSVGTSLCTNPTTNLSEELRISTDDRKMFDSSKFMDMRNHSTESNASTSSAPALGSNSESIPRKSVIQEDIRLNKGRFSLVRKRGRSEVWNLFGQVVDNLTGQRLPFVACYACKVLYTDTGGGTGNMTRHRCPIGSSYRSFAGSSTDTISDMINTQSSFESVNMAMPFSPEAETQESQPGVVLQSVTAQQSREAFRESGSQHPSLSSCGLASASTHFSTSTESAPLSALLPSSSTSTAQATTPLSGGGGSSLTGIQPTSGSAFTPTGSIGYSFNPSDKELFAQALVKFIAEDLHSTKIVETEAFTRLIETALFIGRRCTLTSVPTATDTLKNLIPSARQLTEVLDTHLHYAKNATAMDLSTLKDLGISLIAQQITYNGEEFFSLWSSYISDDWRSIRRCLNVDQTSENFEEFVVRSVATFGLSDANKIRITLDNDFEEIITTNFPENIIVVDNVNHAINKILKEVFSACAQIETVLQILLLFLKIIAELVKMGALTHLSRSKVLPNKLMSPPTSLDEINYSNDIYCLLKFVRENHNKIINVMQAQHGEEIKELGTALAHVDWALVSDMEMFLEPFYETTLIFNNSKQPHFHRIFPEWYALIHECKASDEDEEDETYHQSTSEATHAPVSSDKHPHPSTWLRSLRHSAEQKLKDWAKEHIKLEHQVATVLNPRLKHLPVICTDVQRFQVYGQIRDITGLSKARKEKSGEPSDGEPAKKRKKFLSQLEDAAIEDDELECYLRTPFTPQQTKDILEFWSTVGENQFPRLAKLARFILSMVGAAAPIELSNPSASRLTAENLNGLLMLRSVYGL